MTLFLQIGFVVLVLSIWAVLVLEAANRKLRRYGDRWLVFYQQLGEHSELYLPIPRGVYIASHADNAVACAALEGKPGVYWAVPIVSRMIGPTGKVVDDEHLEVSS